MCFSGSAAEPPPAPPTLTDALEMLRDSRRMLAARAAALRDTAAERDHEIARLQGARAPSAREQMRGYVRRRLVFSRMAQRFDDAVTTVESHIQALANVSTLRHVASSMASARMHVTPAVTVLSMQPQQVVAEAVQRACTLQDSLHQMIRDSVGSGEPQAAQGGEEDELEMLDTLEAALRRALPSVPLHEPVVAAQAAAARSNDEFAIKMSSAAH